MSKHFLYVPLALLLLAGCEYFNLPLDRFIETHAAVISVESVTFDTGAAGRFLPDSGIYVLEPPSPLDSVTVYINLKNDVNLAFDCALTGTVNGVDAPGRITPVETGERRLRVNIANPGNGERYDIRLAIHAETGRLFNISVPPILCSARWTVAQATLSGTVSIDGTTIKAGHTLTANIAGIIPSASASDYTYQWKRDAADISGAAGATYTLVVADEGTIISVAVSRVGYAGSVTAATAKVTPYTVGDTGPAGGIIFYVDNGTFGGGTWKYLEAAPADISGTLKWASSSSINIPGTQTDIGTGAANTAAILTPGKDPNAPAAKACADYRAPTPYNTFNDWFLPSLDELYAMWTSGITATPGNGFNTSGNYYWSSSEYSTSLAWLQNFSDGSQDYSFKNSTYCVRAVRAF